MASKHYLSVVQHLGEAVGRVIGVLDENSSVVACSDISMMNSTRVGIPMDMAVDDVLRHGGYTYRYVDPTRRGAIVFVEGEDPEAVRCCSATAVVIEDMMRGGDDRDDITTFIKNVVTNNILPSDTFVKARDLDFATDVRTASLVIRYEDASNSVSVLDIVSQLFPMDNKDFVFNVNENETVLVKDVEDNIDMDDLCRLGESIADVLENEHRIHVNIGIGSIVNGVKEMSTSFKEARTALEVGKVFDTEHTVISYENLGIARLIYQLPTTICQQFLQEVFKIGSIDSLDQETLFTIQRFFDNNLNVSETSRGLFVHRNTLVYRLEKIKKITGLDLREFDQAIIFKVALMVRKYLDSTKNGF